LTEDVWHQLHGMRDAVLNHPAAGALLRNCRDVVIDLKTTDDASPEGFSKSIANWRYDVQAPYYLDGLREALRQSGDQPPAEGAAELSAYWIDEKTGVLCRCRPDFWRGEPKHFVFIAVEKKPPYAVGVYVLDEESMALGAAKYRANLNTYAECLANDNWPGYGDKVQTISVPAWSKNRNAHLLDGAA
jgi:exodeoxyribonuclease VIII